MSRPTISVTHNAGFFSCCTVRLMNIIKNHKKNKILPIVDSSRQWDLYKDFHKDEDITNRFFKEKKIYDFEPEDMIFCKTENQFSDYTLINYPYTSKLIDTYFSPSDEIIQIKNFLIKKYDIDVKNIVGVYYRGNDKVSETNIPSYDEMLDKINLIMGSNENKKLLIQTDELEFSKYIKNFYPNSVIIEENKMINKSIFGVHFTIQNGEKINKSQTFLSTILILSECKKLIINSGNVGMWICLYRGNNENVYQYLNPKDRILKNKWIN